jgi:hypothetical protein
MLAPRNWSAMVLAKIRTFAIASMQPRPWVSAYAFASYPMPAALNTTALTAAVAARRRRCDGRGAVATRPSGT